MSRSPKLPFDALPSLPVRDDKEVITLMDAVERLPREGVNEVARCLLRAALGHERTGDAEYLICLAEGTLFTMRLRSHPLSKEIFNDEPDMHAKPRAAGGLEESVSQLAEPHVITRGSAPST